MRSVAELVAYFPTTPLHHLKVLQVLATPPWMLGSTKHLEKHGQDYYPINPKELRKGDYNAVPQSPLLWRFANALSKG